MVPRLLLTSLAMPAALLLAPSARAHTEQKSGVESIRHLQRERERESSRTLQVVKFARLNPRLVNGSSVPGRWCISGPSTACMPARMDEAPMSLSRILVHFTFAFKAILGGSWVISTVTSTVIIGEYVP